MSLEIPCPDCGEIFTSEMNLEFHYRNAHQPGQWILTFDGVLDDNKIRFPDKATDIDNIKNSVVTTMKNECCTRKKKAKVKRKLKEHIQKFKEEKLKGKSR